MIDDIWSFEHLNTHCSVASFRFRFVRKNPEQLDLRENNPFIGSAEIPLPASAGVPLAFSRYSFVSGRGRNTFPEEGSEC